MEILWPALGICILVGFVFFVLAQHWQRVLRHQNWSIRRLTERIRKLEEVDDPEFRRRLGESTPSPLEKVFTFSLRLSDRFWRNTLHATDESLSFIRASGTLLGSVKIERWRGHSVATITEVLPERQSASWQSRSLDCFFDNASGFDSLTLWEVSLARVQGSVERPPSVELVLQEKYLELCAHLSPSSINNGSAKTSSTSEIVFLRVPLDSAALAEFRSHDPLQSSENGGSPKHPIDRNFWRAFYSHDDQEAGIEWQLWVRDLTKKEEWDRWHVLEPAVDSINAKRAEK